MKLVRAWAALVGLSFRRLLWSSATLVLALPLAACVLFVVRRRYAVALGPRADFEEFSQFLLFVFAAIVVPIIALAYGTTSVGGDREDRTLLWLLVRPVPRWLLLGAKFTATLPLALGLAMGSYWLCCRLAGPAGQIAEPLYAPAVFYSTLAYLGLFQLLAVAFRHATIIAIVYSLFMELLLGNLPGIVKHVAINYYGRSLMYAAGAIEGLEAPDPRWFEPLAPATAVGALWGFSLLGLLLSMFVFQRREYRDLT